MKSLLVAVALSMSAIAAQAYDDIDVGMCAMYHVVIGNKAAADLVRGGYGNSVPRVHPSLCIRHRR